MNILIVDDDLNVHRILSRVVAREGHTFMLASRGQEALDLLQSHPIDLIFLDIHMPGMSGLTVLRRLKDSAETEHIPVVVMTAYFSNDNIAGAIGAYDIFSKTHLIKDATRVIGEFEKSD